MHGQRAGDGKGLLLSTGDIVGITTCERLHLGIDESLLNTPEDLIPGNTQVGRTEGDIIAHGQGKNLHFRVLHDDGNMVSHLIYRNITRVQPANDHVTILVAQLNIGHQPIE